MSTITVLFLLDNDKSSYITGQDLIIDGGWTIKGFKMNNTIISNFSEHLRVTKNSENTAKKNFFNITRNQKLFK